MENKTTKESDKDKGVALRIQRVQGEVRATFTNNYVFQLQGDEFHVRFYQIIPPIVLGETEEERMTELEKLHGIVETPCVSHIVMSASKMQEFLEKLTEHVQKHTIITTAEDQGEEVNGDSTK